MPNPPPQGIYTVDSLSVPSLSTISEFQRKILEVMTQKFEMRERKERKRFHVFYVLGRNNNNFKIENKRKNKKIKKIFTYFKENLLYLYSSFFHLELVVSSHKEELAS